MQTRCDCLIFLFTIFGDKQVNTERAIRHAIQERLPIVVVINKVILSLFSPIPCVGGHLSNVHLRTHPCVNLEP